MAFGFAQHTSGLIVDPVAAPQRVRRYVADFAAAYADEIVVGSQRSSGRGEAASGRVPDLLISLDATDRAVAEATGARFVPCFPDPVLFGDPITEAPWAEATTMTQTPGNAGSRTNARTAGRENRVPANDHRAPLRVCLFGPESTGKTTLASALAAHYRTLHVTEYVRGYLDATGSGGTAADVPWIARGQRAAEIATARQVDRLLVCDTNLATILLWSEVLFGEAPQWLRDEAMRQSFDVWLLTDIDVPFEADPQRCFPAMEDRVRLMAHCMDMLGRLGVTPVRLRGAPHERSALAIGAIDRALAHALY
ncbi:MAG: ATP-binding protein [Betaproteobacteria bacterium]